MRDTRYTIRIEIVTVDDNGDDAGWIYRSMLEWATTDRSLIFREANKALSTLNENRPGNATMREINLIRATTTAPRTDSADPMN